MSSPEERLSELETALRRLGCDQQADLVSEIPPDITCHEPEELQKLFDGPITDILGYVEAHFEELQERNPEAAEVALSNSQALASGTIAVAGQT